MQTMLPRLPIKTYRSRETKNWEEEKQLVGKEINRVAKRGEMVNGRTMVISRLRLLLHHCTHNTYVLLPRV